MIKRFKEVEGQGIREIAGQNRLAFTHSGTTDFYDLIDWAEVGGYQGSIIIFFDFDSGNVYRPFVKKRNVIYGDPVYIDGFYYFLQCNYDEKTITLYRYLPEKVLEIVTQLSTEEVNLYNLRIIGNSVNIISHDHGKFERYYPEKVSFSLGSRETVVLMDNGVIYCEKWVEEGWDQAKKCATDQYKYYTNIVTKDYTGQTLSEELGSLYQTKDGTWWIA